MALRGGEDRPQQCGGTAEVGARVDVGAEGDAVVTGASGSSRDGRTRPENRNGFFYRWLKYHCVNVAR